MPVDIIMPQMGESIFEGTITKWLKKAGEHVERDEPLFEISTDKVDAEIPAPSAGILKEIKVGEGQTVPIQTVVGVIETDGNSATATPPEHKAPTPVEAPMETASPIATASPASQASIPAPTSVRADGDRVRSSPLVRRLAREYGIDISQLRGTGAGGRISKKDILAAIAGSEAVKAVAAPSRVDQVLTTPTAPVRAAAGASGEQVQVALESAVPRERMYFGHYEVQPMSLMRQRIAEHMLASKRVSPHVYSIDEADITRIVEIREDTKSDFESKYGLKLTFMPFFIRACIEGLRAYPILNSSVDGTNVVVHKEINIGMAVALDWGLIVPVIKSAEEKNFLGLQRAVTDLAERARSKRLMPEEVQEGTFSITNPGVFGGLMGLPVINQPNVAILGLGSIQKRPVVIHDAIAIRSMVYLSLSYDHRAVDGAIAHQFLHKVKSALENWNESIL